VFPVHASHAVRQDISTVCRIPADYISKLFSDLAEVTNHKYALVGSVDRGIMTHGVNGIDWKHYKHPLQRTRTTFYIQYWKDMEFQQLIELLHKATIRSY
jgi:hypothetical protein